MDLSLDDAIEVLAGLRGDRPRGAGRVTLSLDGDVAELVVDNPPARHALTVAMMGDLGRAVVALRAWPGAAVLLRASTRSSFCAGGHLGEVRAFLAHPEHGRSMAVAMSVILDALLGLPQVTVAAVDGPAVGGGVELLTATDHRVFAAGAWFELRQAALGVGAGWGGLRRLSVHVPRPVALRWVTTARRVDVEEAVRSGFADDVVSEDAVAGAWAFLAPVLRLPREGVRAVKRQLVLARAPCGDRVADADVFADVWGGPVHRVKLG